jgi:hypothetical protein
LIDVFVLRESTSPLAAAGTAVVFLGSALAAADSTGGGGGGGNDGDGDAAGGKEEAGRELPTARLAAHDSAAAPLELEKAPEP